MKLIDLFEQNTSLTQDAQVIVDKCKPWLEAVSVDQVVLWRGAESGDFSHNLTYKKPRTDRQPRDTNPLIHKIADQYFTKQFGVPLRSSSAFVTLSEMGADRYGRAQLTFPVGTDWAIYGAPGVTDFTAYVNRKVASVEPELFHEYLKPHINDELPEPTDQAPQHVKDQTEQVVTKILNDMSFQRLTPQQLNQLDEPRTELHLVAHQGYYMHQLKPEFQAKHLLDIIKSLM